MTNAFTDPAHSPTPANIRQALGETARVWDELCEILSAFNARPEWRHYRDGGWLAKAASQGRTLAWLSIAGEEIKVGIYFSERHRPQLIALSDLTPHLRKRFDTTELMGKLLPVALTLGPDSDLSDFEAVTRFRAQAR